MKGIILSIGTELTTGQVVDTNASWVAAELTRIGVRVIEQHTVGDDLVRLVHAIRSALDNADFVIATGGLGPTPDDLTRQAIADALGVSLETDPVALEHLRQLFEKLQRPMRTSNEQQALVPHGCELIPNDHGTAPGILFESEETQLFALPGVPREMKAMFRGWVAPRITKRTGGVCTHITRLHCFGISEARIGEDLVDLMASGRNPMVGTSAKAGVITVRIVAGATDKAEAERLASADVDEVRKRLGDAVFGERDETLEGVVAQLLKSSGETLATAESCTGGLLAKRLTDLPGSSVFFLGGHVTYANEAKTEMLGVEAELIATHGAVSEPVAMAMASGCRTSLRCDFALSITGIAGPDGGSPPDKPVGLVYIALADKHTAVARRVLIGDYLDRATIRDRACSLALDMLRRRLLSETDANK